MPRLELGTKFWIADVVHGGVQIRWGEIGTAGKSVRRATPAGGERAKLDELIAARLAEGYAPADAPVAPPPIEARWTRRYKDAFGIVEVTLDGRRVCQRRSADEPPEFVVHKTADDAREIAERIATTAVDRGMTLVLDTSPMADPAKLVVASNPELVAQCRAAPDDPAPWAVYADWLFAQGDLRGELAARVNGGDPSSAQSMRARWFALFDERAELGEAVQITGFRFGFPSAIVVASVSQHDRLDELVAGVLELPLFELLAALRIPRVYAGTTGVIEAIARSPHAATLRELEVGNTHADSGPPLLRLTGLRALTIGGLPRDHPTLQKLVLFVHHASDLEALARVALPALEQLELRVLADRGYILNEAALALAAVFARTDLPALRHLALVPVQAAIAALASSPLLRQLRTLDLASEPLTASAARQLADDAAAFRHLERIDVGPHRGGRIARELPNVRIVAAP